MAVSVTDSSAAGAARRQWPSAAGGYPATRETRGRRRRLDGPTGREGRTDGRLPHAHRTPRVRVYPRVCVRGGPSVCGCVCESECGCVRHLRMVSRDPEAAYRSYNECEPHAIRRCQFIRRRLYACVCICVRVRVGRAKSQPNFTVGPPSGSSPSSFPLANSIKHHADDHWGVRHRTRQILAAGP